MNDLIEFNHKRAIETRQVEMYGVSMITAEGNKLYLDRRLEWTSDVDRMRLWKEISNAGRHAYDGMRIEKVSVLV